MSRFYKGPSSFSHRVLFSIQLQSFTLIQHYEQNLITDMPVV